MKKMQHQKIKVNLKERSYNIFFGSDLLHMIPEYLAELDLGRQLVILSVPPVAEYYLDPLREHLEQRYEVLNHVVPDGESSKSNKILESIYTWLIEKNIERTATILALGGGVIGDLAGYVAATYLRGINLIHIPTSLLAQVDSSIGGKVGINHRFGKNLIGSFYQPRAIFTDIDVLKTLPEAEYICGLGEIIKYAIIRDPHLFDLISNNTAAVMNKQEAVLRDLVYRCIKIKAQIVSRDERESGLRAILNFGHTFAHALETYYQHSGLKHGQAVLMGMTGALYVSKNMRFISATEAQKIENLMNRFRLQLPPTGRIPASRELVEIMFRDKKVREGKIRLILIRMIGKVEQVAIDDASLLEQAFAYLIQKYDISK